MKNDSAFIKAADSTRVALLLGFNGYITIEEAATITSLSTRQIKNLRDAEKFPEPVPLSGQQRKGFRAWDILAWNNLREEGWTRQSADAWIDEHITGSDHQAQAPVMVPAVARGTLMETQI